MLSRPWLIIFLHALSYTMFMEELSLERNLRLGDVQIYEDLLPSFYDRANTHVVTL